MAKDKRDYIASIADMKRNNVTPQEYVADAVPKRRAIMTSDDDELFIKKYYKGRTEAFRTLLTEDKIKKGWIK